MQVAVDLDADAAYIRLSGGPIQRTQDVTDDVLVDLDEFAMVVGVELLSVNAVIPFQRLVDEFHVHSDVVEQLRRLRPSIAAQLFFEPAGASTVGAHDTRLEPAS